MFVTLSARRVSRTGGCDVMTVSLHCSTFTWWMRLPFQTLLRRSPWVLRLHRWVIPRFLITRSSLESPRTLVRSFEKWWYLLPSSIRLKLSEIRGVWPGFLKANYHIRWQKLLHSAKNYHAHFSSHVCVRTEYETVEITTYYIGS